MRSAWETERRPYFSPKPPETQAIIPKKKLSGPEEERFFLFSFFQK
jgi:hypothetical protein